MTLLLNFFINGETIYVDSQNWNQQKKSTKNLDFLNSRYKYKKVSELFDNLYYFDTKN